MNKENQKEYKIAFVNTSDYNGGAAIACYRIFEAIVKKGIDATFFVQEKITQNNKVVNICNSIVSNKSNTLFLAFEKLHFYFFEKSKNIRFAFSTAIAGKKIYKRKDFRQHKIIHLNWFNQGFLSLKGLEKILKNHKVVWTLHDMWAFTGGCHYNDDCFNFRKSCGNCKYLKNPRKNDISKKQFLQKKRIYENANLVIVTSSQWLAEEAKTSTLFRSKKIYQIFTPMDLVKFKPIEKKEARKYFNIEEDKFVILFGAASLKDTRKGFKYLIEALNILKQQNNIDEDKIRIALFGKPNYELDKLINYKVVNLGFIKEFDEIVKMYSLSDVYVTTALQDNLPNTVMESISFAVPVVAFNIGGIPEMVKHKYNGFLAEIYSSEQIADGINWIYNSDIEKISGNARNYAIEIFDENKIAEQYEKIYKSLL